MRSPPGARGLRASSPRDGRDSARATISTSKVELVAAFFLNASNLEAIQADEARVGQFGAGADMIQPSVAPASVSMRLG